VDIRSCVDRTGRPFQIGQRVAASIHGITGVVSSVHPSCYALEPPLVYIHWDTCTNLLEYGPEDAREFHILDAPESELVDCTGRYFRAGDIIDCSGWVTDSKNPGVTMVFRVDLRYVYTTPTTLFDKAAAQQFRILARPKSLVYRRLSLAPETLHLQRHATSP